MHEQTNPKGIYTSIRCPAVPVPMRSGEEDVERGVLGGRAHGARLDNRLAPTAEAQVPARQQQHARIRRAARPARPRAATATGHVVVVRAFLPLPLRLEAARPRVLHHLSLALLISRSRARARRLEEELLEGSAQARGGSLVAAGDALPRLPLRAHLTDPLAQLRIARQRARKVGLRRPQAPRGAALHGRHHGADVPAPRLLQPRPQPLVLRESSVSLMCVIPKQSEAGSVQR